MTTTPRGSPELAASQAVPETTVNEQIRRTEGGAGRYPVADRVTAPPGSCADGAQYIIIATATGAFAGKEGQIAQAVGTNAASGWNYRALGTIDEGILAYVQDEDVEYKWSGSAWGAVSGAYTDENAQDAVGAMVDSTLTYTDATPLLGVDTAAEAERIRDVIGTALVAGSNVTITVNDAGDTITIASSGGGGGGLSDGDYGDITVSGTGTTMTVDNDAITLAKIQNATANSKLLGSGASGSGADYVELSLGTNLSMSGTTLNATGGGQLGPAWTDLTFGSTSTILGTSGSYAAGQTFTPVAEDRVEVEALFHVATGTGFVIGLTDGTNGYYLSLQTDDNLVLYRYNGGSATSLSALGAVAANRWNGFYEVKFILVTESSSSNRLRTMVNDKAFPDSNQLTQNTTFTMLNALTPYIKSDNISRVWARARLIH